MSSTHEQYYDRYWGKEGQKSPDVPIYTTEEATSFWNIFDPWYKAAGKELLVDLGCGEGHFLAHTRDRYGFRHAFGLDVSPQVIREASRLYPSVEFVAGAMEQLPLPDGSVDVVQSIAVVEHVLDLKGALSEVARVLKPGGVFLCYTTDFNLLKQVLIGLFFWDRYFDPQSPHIRFLKRSTYRDLLRSCGLEEVGYRWHRSYLGVMPQGMCHVARKPA